MQGESVVDEVAAAVDPQRFRRALAHFCTGVTVVTGIDDGRPVGFACQSFAALSLDPPLVLFCPSRHSGTWPAIERSGHFCVNVLAHAQRDVSGVFGRPGPDRFAGIRWSPAPSGSPTLPGVLTWVDCDVEAVHEAGDHYIVVGRVRSLGEHSDEPPLLFYRGAYTGIEPSTGVEPPVAEVLEEFLTWPRHDDWM